MPTRRSFLRYAAGATGLACVPGSVVRAASGRSAARTPRVIQPSAFQGSRPGEERTIEGLRLCWCPPGRFTMGSRPEEAGRRADEAAAPVTLTRGFWMATFETTQGQWREIVGPFPSTPPSAQFGEGNEWPVYWVSYLDATTFCERLAARARRSAALPEGWAVRLPTEAQWEYACRAGTTTAFAHGEQLDLRHANFKPDPPGGPVVGRAARVGSYPANPWGIYDMHGNIFEWCRDWYHATLPGGTDPDLSGAIGVRNGDGTYSRVRRGGAWNDPAWACRSALRLRYEPERNSDHIGFRVVIDQVT